MRIVIDSLIVLMLVGVVIGALVMHNNSQTSERDVEEVRAALNRLNEQAAYHTAVQSAMAGHDTMLVHMHEEWFGEDLPVNVLLGEGHPWIDLAPPGDLSLHPPDPVATESSQAGFWYNPTTGTFRARVTPCANEAETLALYNQINDTALTGFEQMPDPSRKPIAHVLGSAPAQQYASLANQTWAAPGTVVAQQEQDQPLYVSPTEEDLLAEIEEAQVDSPDTDQTRAHLNESEQEDSLDNSADDSNESNATTTSVRPRLK